MKTDRLKHVMLSDWLREHIQNGTFSNGTKIPSENELAEQFHISRQTVRLAISNLEREGLLERIKGSGTFVKAPLKNLHATKNIGVIITYLDDYIFPSIVQGIEQILRQNGYTMTFGITYNRLENEAKALYQMQRTGIDGLIAEGTKSALPNPNAAIYRQMSESGIPSVFINGYYSGYCKDYVILDDVVAGQTVTEELIRNGHHKIGGFFKSDDMQGHKRYEGFSKAMTLHGLEMQDDALIWYTTEDLDYLFGGNLDDVMMKRLEKVTGIVCYNDLIAVKLIALLNRKGIQVPQDKSIVSFDNSSLSSKLLYGLTSYIYPSKEIGEAAAKGILQKIKDPGSCVQTVLKSNLKRRASVFRFK